jgi:uncharacterized protein YecA (UPF0149 family)
MSLANYTIEQLQGFLKSDNPLPAPLTREEVYDAVIQADRRLQKQKSDEYIRVMRLREQQKEAEFQSIVIEMTSKLDDADKTIRQQQADIHALRWAISWQMHRASSQVYLYNVPA